jgi:hypothetical protein
MIGRLCIACLICAEALALYAFAELIANGYADDRHAVAAWALILTVALAYVLPQFAASFFVSERTARIALTVAAIVVIYGLMRIEYAHDFEIWNFGWIADFLREPSETFKRGAHASIGFLFLLAAWLWGAYRANGDIEPELVARGIAGPFILVTVIVMAGAGTHRGGEIGRAAVAFYVLDVLALALSQLSLSGADIGSLRAGGVVATLIGGTVAVVFAGVLLVTLVFAVIQPAFGPTIGSAVDHLLTWALTPVAWLFEWLFGLLIHGNNLPKLDQSAIEPAAQAPKDSGGRSAGELAGLYLLRGLAIVIVIAVVAGIIGLVARLRRRAGSATPAAPNVATAGSLGDDAGDFLRRMLHRPPRPARDTSADATTRLYVEVLREAEKRGTLRPPSATPTEFVEPLRRAFQNTATDEITRAFEQARYAGRPPDAEALARLRDRWQQAR